MHLTSRRQFLWIAAGAAGPLGLGAAAWMRQHRSADGAQGPVLLDDRGRLQAVTQRSWAMGSKVALTVLHRDRETARRAVAAAMDELRLVERLMSLYRPESQLCRLNRDGALQRPHPYLVEVLRQAMAVSQRSDGAFDCTVQPLWTLYAEAQKAGRLPDAAAIEAAVQLVDWRRVEITAQRIRLCGRGVAVTLNGIAQGFAADRAMAVLRLHGIEHALVDTGEIGSLGDKGEGMPWTVGIQHPRRENAWLALAKLQGRCLATSGDYATRFGADYAENHLFDPHTGRSPRTFSSVSVAAGTAAEADALATAVFVLGVEKGLQLVHATPGADALLVLKDGRTLATAGFPQET